MSKLVRKTFTAGFEVRFFADPGLKEDLACRCRWHTGHALLLTGCTDIVEQEGKVEVLAQLFEINAGAIVERDCIKGKVARVRQVEGKPLGNSSVGEQGFAIGGVGKAELLRCKVKVRTKQAPKTSTGDDEAVTIVGKNKAVCTYDFIITQEGTKFVTLIRGQGQ